jgi:hypothetical protein
MKKTIVIILSLAVVASLVGCEKKGQNEAKDGTGIKVQVPGTTVAVGAQLPDNLPPYVQVYPNSEVISVISGMGDQKNVAGIIIAKTKAPMNDVVAFYKLVAQKNGMTAMGEFSTQDVHTFAAEAGEKSFGIALTKGDDNTTSVQLTYK